MGQKKKWKVRCVIDSCHVFGLMSYHVCPFYPRRVPSIPSIHMVATAKPIINTKKHYFFIILNIHFLISFFYDYLLC